MVRIGLTGGPGSGKSTVAGILERRNIAVVDLDCLSRTAVKPGQAAYKKIVDYFGKSAILESGELDRVFLRTRLIKSREDKKNLEKFIHPEVFRLLEKEYKKYLKSGEKIFCVEAPLLFEKDMKALFDYIITVFIPYELQIERLVKRDSVTEEGAEGLVNSQISLAEKAARSDFIITNDKGFDELEKEVDKVLKKILK
ncbi:MAG: dephospho-CoA kinase [Deltaproteobacteria bacterium]|nr:MAG: dephospho-CoA kinase [Deltaproteobacteria bacterium]